jgi:hypothetical protein
MHAKRFVIFLALAILIFYPNALKAFAADSAATLIEARSFTLKGPLGSNEPQRLDFHYAPYRWQTNICLPDDPHKSIVGSDGGLYYDYGGGRYYDFKTRILASIDAESPAGKIRQSLLNPRIPVLITEQNAGTLSLRQQAWAGTDVGENQNRADYLWLRLKNNSSEEAAGRIVVQVDSTEQLALSEDHTRLVEKRNPGKIFCVVDPACMSVEYAAASSDSDIVARFPVGMNRNWANPKIVCDRHFRDVLVGWGRPIALTYPAKPGKTYHVAFGLIEGWHKKPGVRPLEIRIESRLVRSVDLVKEVGQNVPAVFCFDATDRNNDGLLEMGIYSPSVDIEDKNTILSGLWIFEPENAPNEKEILAGGIDNRALAVMDIKKVSQQDNSLKLFFNDDKLAAGGEYEVLMTLYQGDKASAKPSQTQAGVLLQQAVDYWDKVDLPYDRMNVPDKHIQGLLDSCIRNIYQAREIKDGRPAFQVGPTCYRGTWAADGPFILEAVTYLGRATETRAGIEQQVDKDQGPGGVEFSKKSGLRLWMILRHAQLTGDRVWLEKMWPRVQREVNQIIEYRRMTMDDPDQANYGLMPIGFGDGGLGGKHREYTNVYWTLAGLKSAIEIAQKLGKPELNDWRAEYSDYWETFDKARNRDKLKDSHGTVYVPVTMKGEAQQLPQRGAWAFLQSIFPGRIFEPNDNFMLGTMAMLDANQREGLIYGTGWLPDGIWNYAGSFYGHAHLWLGHGEKTASIFYAFANHASSLLCWREEQNLVGEKENYCGDMPHNWASAEFIRMVRHMLILERGSELHLLEGLPSGWTRPDATIKMTEIPTSFGPVTFSMHVEPDGESAELKILPPQRENLDKIVVHLEHFGRPVRLVSLNGRRLDATTKIQTNRSCTLKVEF